MVSPAPLKSFEIVPNFQNVGDAVIFKRDLPSPKDELIILASALPAKAAAFEATRPADAAMMLKASKAYQNQLAK
jgi:hypothetical protein